MGLLLLVRWSEFFGITLIALAGADIYDRLGALAIAAASILIVVFSLAYRALVERALTRFGSLSPQFCSMYEPYSWWHERYWKLHVPQNLRRHGFQGSGLAVAGRPHRPPSVR